MQDFVPMRVEIALPAPLSGRAIIDVVRAVAGREFYRVHRRSIGGGEIEMIGVNAVAWRDDLLICPGSAPNPMFFEPAAQYSRVVIEQHVWAGDTSTTYYPPDELQQALDSFARRLEPALLDRIPGRCVVCSWVSAADSKFCNQCGKPLGGNTGVTTKLVLPAVELVTPIISEENIQRLLLAVRNGAVLVAHGYDYSPPEQAEAKAFLYRMSENITMTMEEFTFYIRAGLSSELTDWLGYICFDAFTQLVQRDVLQDREKREAMSILEAFASAQPVALELILTYLLKAVELSVPAVTV